jgi:hypothetical protein
VRLVIGGVCVELYAWNLERLLWVLEDDDDDGCIYEVGQPTDFQCGWGSGLTFLGRVAILL